MLKIKSLLESAALCGIGFGAAIVTLRSSDAAEKEPVKPPRRATKIVGWNEADTLVRDWGQMRRFLTGGTFGTKAALCAVAVVEPGKAVHRAHRHAAEEYLWVSKGQGTWSVDGKESAAKQGDMLYVDPWVYHGLTNTGDKPLTFIVVRYVVKGLPTPPPPNDGKPNEL